MALDNVEALEDFRQPPHLLCPAQAPAPLPRPRYGRDRLAETLGFRTEDCLSFSFRDLRGFVRAGFGIKTGEERHCMEWNQPA